MTRSFRWMGWMLLVGTSALVAEETAPVTAAQVTAALAKLQPGVAPEEQRDALNEIATSLDPRIPGACLPLLQSPGQSVQRNAARAIGSRWWQIPAKELPTYQAKLRPLFESKDDDVQRMARRGVGLLAKTFEGEMFSRSPNKRWVVYERRGKPCLIDTTTQTEELLGFEWEGKFLPYYGNQPVQPASHWHPSEDAVVFEAVIFRKVSEVWIWHHKSGVHRIRRDDILPLLSPANGEIAGGAGFFLDFARWEGRAVEMTLDYGVKKEDQYLQRIAVVRWDLTKRELRVVSDKENP